MPVYNYVALSGGGSETKGTLTADNTEKARIELKRMDLMPITIEEQGALSKDINITFLEKKPKPRDLSVFCRQFVSILDAGVPVVKALDILAGQTENKKLRAAIQNIRMTVEKGESLAAAFGYHIDIFGGMFISLVRAGEESGSLSVSLERMAIQYEKSARLQATIKKASIYPVVLLVVMVAVVILMLVMVIPQFESMFVDLGTSLPAITIAVMNMSEYLQGNWYIVVLVIAAVVVGFRLFVRTPLGHMLFSRLTFRLPVIKNQVIKSSAARMSRTMSTLMAAGIPLIDALDIAAGTMTNALFRDALLEAKDDVAMGGTLSESIERTKVFPPMVYQMIAIGEESGDIDGMMTKVADYFDEEVEAATQAMMALMEPAIIIVMALVVGVVIMSVMAPMAEMYSALDNL